MELGGSVEGGGSVDEGGDLEALDLEALDLGGVDLAGGDGDVELPARRWRYRALVIGLVLVLLGGVGALLLTPDGEPTPDEVLSEIRGFVREQRTATFTGVSENTYGPGTDSAGVGHSSTSRSQLTGEFRLPDQLHVVTDSGYWADETIVHGNDVFSRDAESKAELAGEQWEKWDAEPLRGGFPGMNPNPLVPNAALDAAAGFMTAMGAGFPVDLDTLFAKLSKAEEVGPNRIQATVKIGDLVPEEVRRAFEQQKAEFDTAVEQAKAAAAAAAAGGADEAIGDFDEFDFEDVGEAVFDLNFEVALTVTVAYGSDGRLDSLVFDSTDDLGDGEVVKEHEEFHFANWGQPVAITLPGADQVDATPHLDEEGLARLQQRTTVMGLSAPPAGWVLGTLSVHEDDAESETCDAVEIHYYLADEAQMEATMDMPPFISVASVAPCEWLEHNVPDMEDARIARVGAWTAKVVDDAVDNMFTSLDDGLTAVLDVGGTTVVAACNLPEAEFLKVLRSLAPFDLAKQPVARY